MLPAVKRGKISSKIFQLRRHIFHQNHSFSRRIKADFPQSQAISSLFKSFKPWRSGFLILHEYLQPSSDTLLYEALKAQLRRFGGDGKKAFAEPFYKPKADGTPGPLVRKVKTTEKATLTVPVHGGAASNDTMVRVDVFLVPGDGYYWVPVYTADTLKPELPNRAVVQGKPYSEWKEMREEDFIFSLYPNDLVYVEHKSGLKFTLQNADSTLEKTRTQTSAFVYFVGGSISTASITIRTHDNAYGIPSLGVKTLKTFHKYQVDVLGNVFPVHKETRQKFR